MARKFLRISRNISSWSELGNQRNDRVANSGSPDCPA
jgi:hypothetical protein